MCSCKSKEVVTKVDSIESAHTETAYLNESTKVDTTKTIHIEQISDNKVIQETIIVTEYDKDSGSITKETKTERTVRQGIESVVAEEEVKGITEISKDSVNHIADVSKEVESSEHTEIASDSSFIARIIGVMIGCILGFAILKLLNKLRVN